MALQQRPEGCERIAHAKIWASIITAEERVVGNALKGEHAWNVQEKV